MKLSVKEMISLSPNFALFLFLCLICASFCSASRAMFNTTEDGIRNSTTQVTMLANNEVSNGAYSCGNGRGESCSGGGTGGGGGGGGGGGYISGNCGGSSSCNGGGGGGSGCPDCYPPQGPQITPPSCTPQCPMPTPTPTPTCHMPMPSCQMPMPPCQMPMPLCTPQCPNVSPTCTPQYPQPMPTPTPCNYCNQQPNCPSNDCGNGGYVGMGPIGTTSEGTNHQEGEQKMKKEDP